MVLKFKRVRLWITALIVLAVNFTFLSQTVFAGTLTKTTIQELPGSGNPMIISAGNSFAVDFKTVASGATSATINFNNFTGGSVNATQTLDNTNTCVNYFPSAVHLPGAPTASGSGTTVTVSSFTALSATTEYCTILSSTTALTNPGSGGVYSALVTVGSDSQTAAFDVLSNSGVNINSYTITGTVNPSFTMSMSAASDSFPGALSPTALTVSSGITITINTNAASGWTLAAEDTNAGLKSASAGNHLVSSVSTGSNHTMNGGTLGTEAYALGVSANNTANYAYGGGTSGGGLSSSAYNQIATNASPAANVTTVLHELADISGTTPPGTDYTDTITVVGSGQF